MNPAARRADTLERLGSGTYDLLVVGAGILGSRVAYEAACAGLRVALVDAGDFSSATSSASSKLVHGGLRYLATGQFGLVRRAQRERRLLESRIAAPLVWPLPLVLAAVRGGTGRLLLPAAIGLYHALAGTRGPRPRLLDVDQATRLVPHLRPEAIAAAGLVAESQTNDARLVLATVQAAARGGADVANYVRVVGLERAGGRIAAAVLEGLPGEGVFPLRCRAVANCAGPWIDRLRALEHPEAAPSVRFSKGVNITLPLPERWEAAVALFDSSRSVLAAPWHGVLLLGATDAPFEDEPGHAFVQPGDVDALLDAFAGVLDDSVLRRDAVLSACAGLRVLARDGTATTHARRDEVLSVGRYGMVSVAGGKLTTHRLIAARVLRALPADVRPRRLGPDEHPIAHVPPPDAAARLREVVGAECARYLIAQYGATVEWLDVLTAPAAFEPIAAGGLDVWAQAFRARDAEWALSVGDVVERRTTLELRGLARPEVRAHLASVLGLPLSVSSQPSRAGERPGCEVPVSAV